jgi:hypothetical protein
MSIGESSWLSPGAAVGPEGTYVVEGDLLVVPAKRRNSPRSATPNAVPLSGSLPTPTLPSLHRGPVLPIFPFAPVGNIETCFLSEGTYVVVGGWGGWGRER